jgi:hypothetical protein
MRDLGSYAMVYLLAGGGEFGDASSHAQKVGPGDLMWLFPGVPHYYGPHPGGRWDEIYLVFDGPLIDLWRRQNVISPDRPVWHLEPVSLWHQRLEAIALAPALATKEAAFQHLSQFQLLVADIIMAARESSAPAGFWMRTTRAASRTWPGPSACPTRASARSSRRKSEARQPSTVNGA